MDILQCLTFIGNHHIGILADYVNLLDTLPVEVVQVLVVLLLVTAAVVHVQPLKFNLVIQHHEPAFDAQDTGLGQEQECLFDSIDISKFCHEQTACIVSHDKFGQ